MHALVWQHGTLKTIPVSSVQDAKNGADYERFSLICVLDSDNTILFREGSYGPDRLNDLREYITEQLDYLSQEPTITESGAKITRPWVEAAHLNRDAIIKQHELLVSLNLEAL